MGLTVLVHPHNRGYGGNQKTCYREALQRGADIVVMIHPDYQYDSRVIPHLVGFLELGICDVVVGSRIRTREEALAGGMPIWKYLANRALTVVENVALGQNLGDFHSGLRAYHREQRREIDDAEVERNHEARKADVPPLESPGDQRGEVQRELAEKEQPIDRSPEEAEVCNEGDHEEDRHRPAEQPVRNHLEAEP